MRNNKCSSATANLCKQNSTDFSHSKSLNSNI